MSGDKGGCRPSVFTNPRLYLGIVAVIVGCAATWGTVLLAWRPESSRAEAEWPWRGSKADRVDEVSDPGASTSRAPIEEQVIVKPVTEFAPLAIEENVGANREDSTEASQAVAPEIDAVGDIRLEPLDLAAAAPNLTESVVVLGAATGVGTAGASGVIDRLTAEIEASLDQRETLVCWIFDQSVSLASQRKEIASRLDRVFHELGVSYEGKRRDALAHIVIGYGKDYTRITPHETHDGATVVKAIESIDIDDSGIEMTFSAIRKTAEDTREVRRGRNLMIIAFTDEVGNDQDKADGTIAVCRKLRIPVYVVGVAAPFGQRQVSIKFVEPDPQYDQGERWPVVDQGPESLYPELVRIRTERFADEPIDSGFGPFSLSKLCAATNGVYFAVHPNRDASGHVSRAEVATMASSLRRFFDSQVMRAYRPDYLSAAAIDKMLQENAAKRALVQAAQRTEVSPMQSPTTEFVRTDEGSLAGLFSEAQKAAAQLLTKIDPIERTLAAGLPDRAKIKEKRWQAGYDLSMGRILALKVRTFAYNSMLGQAKAGMKFKNPKNNTWELVPADDMSGVDSNTQKLAAQGKMFLERVVAEHPGTPWAALAEEDLRIPLGYRWEERFTPVNTGQMGGGGNPANPADDKKKMLAPPKPKRNLKNL